MFFKFHFDNRVLAGFLVALIILSWLAISSYRNTNNSISSSRMVAHTIEILYTVESVMAVTSDILLSERGYILTGSQEFLELHKKAAADIDTHITNLSKLIGNNKQQVRRIRALKKNVSTLLQSSSQLMHVRPAELQTNIVYPLTSKRIMDNIRALISQIKHEENEMLNARNAETNAHLVNANFTFTGLLFTSGLIFVAVFFAVNNNLKVRNETEKRLNDALTEISDLYDNAPCGYHSLDAQGIFINVNNTLVDWLGYSKDEIVGKIKFTDVIASESLNTFYQNFDQFKKIGVVHDLEFFLLRKDGTLLPVVLNAVAVLDQNGGFIKSRSVTLDNTERKQAEIKIKNLNQELEAFAYSVSHDLRAPLRSIDGYARILQEDYGEKLDTEGQRVTNVIMNNAARMGKLIDDLLEFSRLGRKDIFRSEVNMEQVVANVVGELVSTSERKIDIKINPLAPALGDVDLIRQVWINLVANAIKYTGKTSKPLVSIGSTVRNDDVCYWIKDNGVGFDMQYASKLFGVFQRLHKVQDFAGTGVGLAIVKRIIERHEGKIWADAKINEGATFYFTIPKTDATR